MSHRQAVRSALRMNDGMGVLFARLGSRQHPRGAVWAAYVRALRALRDVLASGGTGPVWRSVQVAQAGDVLRQLRIDVALGVQPVLQDAAALGAAQAWVQLDAYGIDAPRLPAPTAEAAEGLQAVLATVDAQIAATRALLVTGARPDMITGNEERQGPLAAAAVLPLAWFWLAASVAASWGWAVGLYGGGQRPGQRPGQGVWLKQAVAAIDERTTECCLRVHGQVTTLDGEFHTTGRPRFAEWQPNPPFHWGCRTATALVRPEDAADGLTQEMMDAARAELRARAETGRRAEIHPASATSRRRRRP